MLELVDLDVRSFDIDHLDLSWRIKPTTEDLGQYDLIISRSESPGGPFEEVDTLTDATTFRDVNVNRLHTWRTYYYKIKAKHRRDGLEREFGPVHLGAKPPLEALEIARLFKLALREHIGRRVWVFKRRISGQRCGCYDSSLGRRTISECETCYDTGFVGGYWAPIEVDAQIDPAPRSTQLQSTGETQQQNTHARFPNFPLLDPRDIIVEAENVRWRVSQVTNTERSRAVVHQEVQLHRIAESDVEFRLPVRAADPDKASPDRLFTEPQSP